MRKTPSRPALALAAFLVSCAGAPPPAPEPAPSRAAELVRSGADAGQAPAAPAPQPAAAAVPAAAAPAPAPGSAAAAVAAAQAPAPAPAAPAETAQPAVASPDQPPPAPGVLSPEEQAWLQNYLNRLNYMVYYNETAAVDPKLAKAAVSQANRYLIERLGLSVIDFDQIERNKKDQLTAYQSETGGSVGIIQYLAQKFNADVYVEIDFAVATETRDLKHYASAQGTMKIFDTSTATLLGSVAFTSQQAFSPSSLEAAATNAVLNSVWTTMPRVTSQSQELIRNSLQRGVRYEILIQSTPDARAVSNLRRALARKLREVEQVSYSPEETRLYVYSFQSRDKVEDAVYDAAATAGLRDLYLVYMRGKSFTFNTGT